MKNQPVKRKSPKRLLTATAAMCILSVFLLLPLSVNAITLPSKAETIKVAFPYIEGYSQTDKDGNNYGYTYEQLKAISQYTGWQYEFIYFEGTPQEQYEKAIEAIKSGRADLLGNAVYSKEIADGLKYSSLSYGCDEMAIFSSYNAMGDFVGNATDGAAMPDMKIAILEQDRGKQTLIADRCKESGYTTSFVYCQSYDEQRSAVESGRAHGLFHSGAMLSDDMHRVMSIGEVQFYFVTRSSRQSLMSKLDETMISILQYNPEYISGLSKKYFVNQGSVSFTHAEQEYIKNTRVIRLGVVKNSEPYFYYKNNNEAEPGGIIPEVVKLIAEKSGLEFRYIYAETTDELFTMLQQGKIDSIAGMPFDYSLAEGKGVIISAPVMSQQLVAVYAERNEQTDLAAERLVLSYQSSYKTLLFGNDVTEYVQTDKDCLDAVLNGEVDYTYMDEATAKYYIGQSQYWKLKTKIVADMYSASCFAFERPTNSQLLSVINKSIAKITDAEMSKAIADGAAVENKISIGYILGEYPMQILALLIAFIIIMIVLIERYIHNKNAIIKQSQMQSSLYEMLGLNFFEYYPEKQELMIQNTLIDGYNSKMSKVKLSNTESYAGKPGEVFFKTIRSGKEGISEIYDYCEDHENHWIRVTQKNIISKSGDIYCVIGTADIIDEEKSTLSELRMQAETDGLTGLYNSRAFIDMVEKFRKKQNSKGAFLLIDIDHFKTVNDRLGHMSGDQALLCLSKTLKEVLEGRAIIGRYGGDEFTAYLKQISSMQEIDKICGDICARMKALSLEEMGEKVTVSVGGVIADNQDSYKRLFRVADIALYNAKRSGRNQYYVIDNAKKLPEVPKNSSEAVALRWLDDSAYTAILKSAHVAVFEYDMATKTEIISPYIEEYIDGNFDGRFITQVLWNDGVVHALDMGKTEQFYEKAMRGESGEITVRLRTPAKNYRWFSVSVSQYTYPSTNRKVLLGTISDIDDKMDYQEKLEYHANFDSVSGIYNKRVFFKVASDMISRTPAKKHYMIKFDIERFKVINNLFGTAEGDAVLKYVGDTLRKLVRRNEAYGKIADDIFGICVDRTEAETIELVNQITEEVENYKLAFKFFLPMGIAEIPSGSKLPVEVIFDYAGLAQRRIKGNYLVRYMFYRPDMSDELNREHFVTANMEKSLADREFMAYFQPKFDMRNGSIIGAEALARWQRGDMGVISPADFIPPFERNGFIVKLDEYIWEETCKFIRRRIDEYGKSIPISVNVSRIHFYDDKLCGKLIELCQKYNIPNKLLELEITESTYAGDAGGLFPIMDSLRAAGFVLAMDDFGSGYSSLNILKDIPVDVVKLDMRFLEDARNGEAVSKSILAHSISLMKDIKVKLVAEGVETPEQAKFLMKNGCTCGQGYLYSKPIPPEEFGGLLKKQKK